MIFAYIHQWGSNPIDKKGLVIFFLIFSTILVCMGRFKVIIDDESAVFRSDVWIPVRIPIVQIKSVSIVKPSYFKSTKKTRFYIFDYSADYSAKYTICIQLKNDKTYLISIKDAERIKEEIEKRMLKSNDK